jgi:hypothetical protein
MHETCVSKLPRFQPIDRTQIFLRTTDVESLIAEDHPVRAIWIFLDRLDLSKFSEEQRAVEGSVGRSAISPHLLLSIWIYSYARGVSSARQCIAGTAQLQTVAGRGLLCEKLRRLASVRLLFQYAHGNSARRRSSTISQRSTHPGP